MKYTHILLIQHRILLFETIFAGHSKQLLPNSRVFISSHFKWLPPFYTPQQRAYQLQAILGISK